jgi:hypothetical protein
MVLVDLTPHTSKSQLSDTPKKILFFCAPLCMDSNEMTPPPVIYPAHRFDPGPEPHLVLLCAAVHGLGAYDGKLVGGVLILMVPGGGG